MRGKSRRFWAAIVTGRGACLAVLAGCVLTFAAVPVPAAPAQAARQMVAAANPLAAETGREILRAGGSAIDAAIATALVLNLVEPQSSGIGGGAFLLHYDGQTSDVAAYDGRETAPAAATPDLFLRPDGVPMDFWEAVVGGRSVGVPGLVRMFELAHRAHGRLPWAQLFEPAIRLAEDGFAISPRLHTLIAEDKYLKTDPAPAAYFHDANGTPLAAGTTLRNLAFAETLRRIARGGADAFYTGPTAEAIVAAVRGAAANPGSMSVADLAGYQAKQRPVLCGPYRTWRVCGMPPPTSGGVTMLQILGILQGFDLPSLAPDSAEAWHLIAEASRLAFADRNQFLADADFVPVPVDDLLDPAYLARRGSLISPDASLGKAAPGLPIQNGAMPVQQAPPSTSHLVVVDAAGNAVSMTASIESAFGSRLMAAGFMLNNEMTDFSFLPEADGRPVANRVQAGKRPRSSMAPTMVLDGDGRLMLAVGSPGGSRIIGYVLKTVIASLDWGLDVQAAIDLPNVVNRNGATDVEEGAPTALVDGLVARGHEVKVGPLNSGLHGIAVAPSGLTSGLTGVPSGSLTGGADPRREGVALGD